MATITAPTTATPRSSMTALNEQAGPSTSSPTRRPSLDEEIADDERRLEKYGGDDINEPQPKTPHPLAFLAAPQDPNMIAWDGPNDQENPQNWSDRRKWLVTITCVLLSINVYVSMPQSAEH